MARKVRVPTTKAEFAEGDTVEFADWNGMIWEAWVMDAYWHEGGWFSRPGWRYTLKVPTVRYYRGKEMDRYNAAETKTEEDIWRHRR